VKVPLVLSKKEIKRILAMAPSQKAKVMLSLAYGCGLRAAAAKAHFVHTPTFQPAKMLQNARKSGSTDHTAAS
jgi:hypothetical protein